MARKKVTTRAEVLMPKISFAAQKIPAITSITLWGKTGAGKTALSVYTLSKAIMVGWDCHVIAVNAFRSPSVEDIPVNILFDLQDVIDYLRSINVEEGFKKGAFLIVFDNLATLESDTPMAKRANAQNQVLKELSNLIKRWYALYVDNQTPEIKKTIKKYTEALKKRNMEQREKIRAEILNYAVQNKTYSPYFIPPFVVLSSTNVQANLGYGPVTAEPAAGYHWRHSTAFVKVYSHGGKTYIAPTGNGGLRSTSSGILVGTSTSLANIYTKPIDKWSEIEAFDELVNSITPDENLEFHSYIMAV